MGKSKQLNVWVMATEFEPHIMGGLGTVATQLVKGLKHRRLRLTVLSQTRTPDLKVDRVSGIKVIRFPRTQQYYNRTLNGYMSDPLIKWLRKAKLPRPDVIHAHSLQFARAAIILARRYRVPLVYTCHSITSSRIKGSIANQSEIVRAADRVIAPSLWLKGELGRLYPKAASKMTVIPHGADAYRLKRRVKPEKLLYAGRLVRSKGVEPLIRAVALLSPRYKKIRLTIVGKGSVGYTKELRALTKRLKIGPRIRFRGFLPHNKLQRKYAHYGAVIVPSREESFCLVALEAMANGVPLVSTRAGGLKEFVNHSNAHIIRFVRSKDIAHAIGGVLAKRKQTRIRIRRAKVTASRYTWRRASLQYVKLFRQVRSSGTV